MKEKESAWSITNRMLTFPCIETHYDEKRKRNITRIPAVTCGNQCEKCGWNPIERERRWATGEFLEIDVRWNAYLNKPVTVPKGTKRMFFPSWESVYGTPEESDGTENESIGNESIEWETDDEM